MTMIISVLRCFWEMPPCLSDDGNGNEKLHFVAAKILNEAPGCLFQSRCIFPLLLNSREVLTGVL